MGGMRQKSEVGKSRYSFKNYVLKRGENFISKINRVEILLSVYGFVCCVHVGEQRAVI